VATAPSQIVRAGNAVAVAETGRVTERMIAPLSFVNVEEFDARAEVAAAHEPSAHARWLAHSYALRRDPSLIAYYVFDEGEERVLNLAAPGLARRGSPTGVYRDVRDITLTKSTVADARVQGRSAAAFDGSGRHVTLLGSQRELSFGPGGNHEGAFTVSMWIKVDPARAGPRAAVLSKGLGRQEQYAFDLNLGKLRFWVRDRPGGDEHARVMTDPPDGTWQHVAGVYDPAPAAGTAGPTISLYVNGERRGIAPAPRALLRDEGNVVIGARTDVTIAGRQGEPYALALNGLIDEVAFFSTSKSADEIKALYEAGRQQ
jgi:hypothetical protein